MVSAPYLMGIDLGTTTCRCVIFTLQGDPVAAAFREVPVSYPQPLWAEIDPEDWWRCTVAVIREALGKSAIDPAHIAGIGLSGLMHAPVLLNDADQPIIPAMLWMDQRCAPQCESMRRDYEAGGHKRPPTPQFTTTQSAPKLRWLVETQPQVMAQTRHLLLPKDFIRYRLTGIIGTDPSDAGGTGLFDHQQRQWDCAALELARVPEQILPPIEASWAAAGPLTPEAVAATGLSPDTIVAVGGADTFCTRLGVGEMRAGEICIYLGTAAWIALVDGVDQTGQPKFGSFGATATTGAALRWARDLFAAEASDTPPVSYQILTAEANRVPPGSEGLFFLPHLMGERGPIADPLARGALVGLTLRHGRPQMVRAVLEGTAYQLRRLIENRADEHWPDSGIAGAVACGGVAQSPFWMQLLADITQIPLRVPKMVEASVLGAAMLGGLAAGLVSRETVRTQMAHPGHTYTPNPALTGAYDHSYRRYCHLDDLLAPWFREAEAAGPQPSIDMETRS